MLAAMTDLVHPLSSTHTQKKSINYQQGREIDFPLPYTQQMSHINI